MEFILGYVFKIKMCMSAQICSCIVFLLPFTVSFSEKYFN